MRYVPCRRGGFRFGAAWASVVAAGLLVLGAAVPARSAGIPTAGPTAARPNVLLVVTDDQVRGTVTPAVMPNVDRELVRSGTSFSRGFVTTPWCCPSRAGILSGQYSGHNGVWTTGGRLGIRAWQAHESSTLATWLHAAGYRTGIFGKYFNGFGVAGEVPAYRPPGWDTTAILSGLDYTESGGYVDYDLYEGGRIRHYGTADADYSTRVLTARTQAFLTTNRGHPWFAYLAYNAPHGPVVPDPLDRNAGAGLHFPTPANLCEADVGDKPAYVRALRPCRPSSADYDEWMRVRQVQPLAAVDRGIGQLFAALRATGQLRNTLVLYLSDNGQELRNHRLGLGTKEVPYEESIDVPYLARWDALGAAPGPRTALALNIDVAPTIADAAGVTAPYRYDGRSLLPVLRNAAAPWRPDFLIEHASLGPPDRTGPAYCGVRADRWKFVQYATGERELYDLAADPDEMANRAGVRAVSAVEAGLHRRMLQLCDPPPPGWTAP